MENSFTSGMNESAKFEDVFEESRELYEHQIQKQAEAEVRSSLMPVMKLTKVTAPTYIEESARTRTDSRRPERQHQFSTPMNNNQLNTSGNNRSRSLVSTTRNNTNTEPRNSELSTAFRKRLPLGVSPKKSVMQAHDEKGLETGENLMVTLKKSNFKGLQALMNRQPQPRTVFNEQFSMSANTEKGGINKESDKKQSSDDIVEEIADAPGLIRLASFHEKLANPNRFYEKYTISNAIENPGEKIIKAIRCKKKLLTQLRTISEFRIVGEEKRNEAEVKNYQVRPMKLLDGNPQQKSIWEKTKSICSLNFSSTNKQSDNVALYQASPCNTLAAFAFNKSDIIIVPFNYINDSSLLMLDKAYCLEASDVDKNILTFSWSCDSNYIAATFFDSSSLCIWKVRTGEIWELLKHDEIFISITFHTKNPHILLTASFDKILRIWDVHKKKMLNWQQTSDYITCIEFAPSGEFFIVGFFEGFFTVYTYKEKFNQIYSGSINTLSYNINTNSEVSPVKKKNSGILSIFTKKRLVNNKIVRILFLNKMNDDEFFIMSYKGKLKLVSKKLHYTVLESYKQPKKYRVPISLDVFGQHLVMNSENGNANFWTLKNFYTPVINPKLVRCNTKINFSVENYNVFNHKQQLFYSTAFTSEEIVNLWNEKNRDHQVEFFLISVAANGMIRVDEKLKKTSS
jgi:WD40 repeat protein